MAEQSGLGKVLHDLNVNFFEFGVLIAVWVSIFIAASVFSLEDVLSLGPVATVIDGLDVLSSAMPMLFSILCLLGMLFGLFKYRKILSRSVLGMLSKLTRRQK